MLQRIVIHKLVIIICLKPKPPTPSVLKKNNRSWFIWFSFRNAMQRGGGGEGLRGTYYYLDCKICLTRNFFVSFNAFGNFEGPFSPLEAQIPLSLPPLFSYSFEHLSYRVWDSSLPVLSFNYNLFTRLCNIYQLVNGFLKWMIQGKLTWPNQDDRIIWPKFVNI